MKKWVIVYKEYVLCVDKKFRHAGFAENPAVFESESDAEIFYVTNRTNEHRIAYAQAIELEM